MVSAKAYIVPDPESRRSPYDDMDMATGLLILDDTMHGGTRNVVPNDRDFIEEYLDKRNHNKMWEEIGDDYGWKVSAWMHPSEVAEYFEKYGCLTETIEGGLIIMGPKQIAKEYGKVNMKTKAMARALLEAEASTYNAWADGEIYGVVIVECDDDEAGEVEFSPEYSLWEGEIATIWGYYGYDHAEESAKEMLKGYDSGASANRKSKTKKTRSSAKRPTARRR